MSLPANTQIRRDILSRAAQIANANLPKELAPYGAIFREADHLSGSEYMTLQYDPGIFTGMDPLVADQIDVTLRALAQESIRLSLLENQDDFVGLIIAGARDSNPYLSNTL